MVCGIIIILHINHRLFHQWEKLCLDEKVNFVTLYWGFNRWFFFIPYIILMCVYLGWFGSCVQLESIRPAWWSAGVTNLPCCSAEKKTESRRWRMLLISSGTFSKRIEGKWSCHTLWAERLRLYWSPRAQFQQSCQVSNHRFEPPFGSFLCKRWNII